MKTVFFGPFIGEFGWEVLYWSAWVNKLCKSEFKDYKVIVASTHGRKLFYPMADEFWELPDWFTNLNYVHNGYISDGWAAGLPKGNYSETKKIFGIIEREVWKFTESRHKNFRDQAYDLLEYFKQKLPKDTKIVCPFRLNEFLGVKFGVEVIGSDPPSIIQTRMSLEEQSFFNFQATPSANVDRIVKLLDGKSVISVFPRYRKERRPDKNWSQTNYEELIKLLLENFPNSKVAVCGAPGGAYFEDGCPEGVIDLINLDDDERANIQAAVLQKSKFAVGGLSGAMFFAHYCGVPILSWALERDRYRYFDELRLDIPAYFLPTKDPAVPHVFKIINDHLNEITNIRAPYNDWFSEAYLRNGDGLSKSPLDQLKRLMQSVFYSKN